MAHVARPRIERGGDLDVMLWALRHWPYAASGSTVTLAAIVCADAPPEQAGWMNFS